jgi:hypothetical protein
LPFVRLCVMLGLSVFNRGPMRDFRSSVLSCVEHERLEFELIDVRTRGRNLTRLRGLGREEQAEWDRRERAAFSRLADHDLEHGCSG